MLTFKEIKKLEDAQKDNRVKCECGHTVMITNKYKRLICSWCGKMVYLDPRDKFKNKLKGMLKK